MTAQDTLELFFKKLKQKDIKYSDVIPLLTKTQQSQSEYVGMAAIHGNLSGIKSIVDVCSKVIVKEKPGNNNMVQDFSIVFHAKVKYTCRLVKEIDARKPSEDGEWGVNVSSFKLLKP